MNPVINVRITLIYGYAHLHLEILLRYTRSQFPMLNGSPGRWLSAFPHTIAIPVGIIIVVIVAGPA